MSLQVSRLHCARGDLSLFTGIDFELKPGGALHVTGANGSGKTSLLRILCGLSWPEEGEVRWEGREIHVLREAYWCRLFYLGHAPALKDDLLVHENLAMSAAIAGQAVSSAEVYAALERSGLSRLSGLPVRLLSQGQRRRVALARLRLARTPLWILDEPFTALDDNAIQNLRHLFDAHLDAGGMLVCSSHQEICLASQHVQTLDIGLCRAC